MLFDFDIGILLSCFQHIHIFVLLNVWPGIRLPLTSDSKHVYLLVTNILKKC